MAKKPKKIHKKYIPHEFNITFNQKTRKGLRDALIQKFLTEKPGYVRNNIVYVQRYTYYVESLKNEKRIYLKRPASLNKGMDFQINVEELLKFKNGNDKPPSHKVIIKDLKRKKSESLVKFKRLKKLIDEVCNCKEPSKILKRNRLSFKKGFSVEELLKILKWMFIEQDMTYWTGEGRYMLKGGINEI
jgi:hypothetical protein